MNRQLLKDYSMENDGLYCGDTFLAPFNPILEKIVCTLNMDSGKEKNSYIVKIILPNQKELEGHVFSSLLKINFFEVWNECCDAGISKKQKELIHVYLQLQAQTVEKEKQYWYGHLGMYKNAFVFSKENVITMLPKENLIYTTDKELPAFKCREVGKDKKIEYLCRLLSVKKGISETLFICRLFSVLKPLLQKEGYQSGVVVSLYGKSGVGKTQLARTFFVQNSEQEKNFKVSSRKEIEATLRRFAGHSVLIDDFHPESLDYGRKRQDSILDFVARKSDEESALAVITAEFLDGCYSVLDRMLQLKIEGNDLSFEKLKSLREDNEILTSILKDFAETIYCRSQEVIKIVKNIMTITSIQNASSRRISYVIRLLKATLEVFWSLCLNSADKEAIKSKLGDETIKESICDYLEKVEKTQIKNMERLERMNGEVDWLLILYHMLYTEKIFSICPDIDNLDDRKYGGMAVLGKKNSILMRSQTLKKGLEMYFGYKVSSKPLINALVEEHILDEDKSSSHMKKKSDGNYYFVINESLLKLYFQNQSEPSLVNQDV